MNADRYLLHRRGFLGVTAAAALTLPRIGRAEAGALDRITGRAFATGWSIVAPTGRALARVAGAIEAALARVDRQMSPWRPDSETSAVSAGGAGLHRVSPETAGVLETALDIAGETGGCFDPTVGPIVGSWGFGPIAGERVGDWRDLSVAGPRIGKARAGVTIDLCGIAKGWALDRMAAILADEGITDALIELGGELRGLGLHPSGRPWQVAVENPDDPGAAAAVLGLSGEAVATSGLVAQSYAVGGRAYGHIVDPRDGRPAAGALRSVSVLAADGTTADGWATALFAAGPEDGPEFAHRCDVSALFLVAQDGRLLPRMTGRFGEVLL
ncbi:FAD:protein FMN transferase [Rhodobacterales bacterium HKCCE3408]|nr:FAD:protein FMN transferase [Rhodobacterales bacterium HKCCE3408]